MKSAYKVVIDARMIGPHLPGGMARYVGCLAEGLGKIKKSSGLQYEPVFLVRGDLPVEGFWREFRLEIVKAPFLHFSELWEIPRVLSRVGASLYHSPTFSSLIWLPCPWIATVHDLNHLIYGSVLKKIYYKLILKPFAVKAEKLLTVSSFSRHELAEWLGRDESSIEIVWNAIESGKQYKDDHDEELLGKYGLHKGSFFLSLTSAKPHKNAGMLISAYKTFRKKNGGNAWPLVLSIDNSFRGEGIVCVGALSTADVDSLLRSAGAMVFPSLYEGFGLPPVEAAVHGIPVIASDIPPHREALAGIGFDEALFLSPTDLDAWAEGLGSVMKGQLKPPSKESQELLRSRYSIDNLAHDMDRIYRGVLGLG